MRGRRGKAARTPVACEKLLRLVVPRETLRLRVRLLAELAPGSRRDPQRRCADSGDPRHRLQLQGRRAGEHEKRQEDARKSHAISSGKALGSAVLAGVFRMLSFAYAALRARFITPMRQQRAQLPWTFRGYEDAVASTGRGSLARPCSIWRIPAVSTACAPTRAAVLDSTPAQCSGCLH